MAFDLLNVDNALKYTKLNFVVGDKNELDNLMIDIYNASILLARSFLIYQWLIVYR